VKPVCGKLHVHLGGGRWPACERATSDPTPMKGPNNHKTPSTEGSEGRSLTKENTLQSSTCPTQGGTCVTRCATTAENKETEKGEVEKFTALLHHLTVGLLRDCFYALRRRAAPGVEGVTWLGV